MSARELSASERSSSPGQLAHGQPSLALQQRAFASGIPLRWCDVVMALGAGRCAAPIVTGLGEFYAADARRSWSRTSAFPAAWKSARSTSRGVTVWLSSVASCIMPTSSTMISR